MNVDLHGAFYTCRAAVPKLLERDAAPDLVLVGRRIFAGRSGLPDHAAKAGRERRARQGVGAGTRARRHPRERNRARVRGLRHGRSAWPKRSAKRPCFPDTAATCRHAPENRQAAVYLLLPSVHPRITGKIYLIDGGGCGGKNVTARSTHSRRASPGSLWRARWPEADSRQPSLPRDRGVRLALGSRAGTEIAQLPTRRAFGDCRPSAHDARVLQLEQSLRPWTRTPPAPVSLASSSQS